MSAYIDGLKARCHAAVAYMLGRLQENSTYQGLGAIAPLVLGIFHHGTALFDKPELIAGWAAVGAALSAILKLVLPDTWTKTPKLPEQP